MIYIKTIKVKKEKGDERKRRKIIVQRSFKERLDIWLNLFLEFQTETRH